MHDTITQNDGSPMPAFSADELEQRPARAIAQPRTASADSKKNAAADTERTRFEQARSDAWKQYNALQKKGAEEKQKQFESAHQSFDNDYRYERYGWLDEPRNNSVIRSLDPKYTFAYVAPDDSYKEIYFTTKEIYDNYKNTLLSDDPLVRPQPLDPNSIVVVDMRGEEDPNFKILNSLQIDDPAERKIIVDAILDYDEQHPYESNTEYARSSDSMVDEWQYHNELDWIPLPIVQEAISELDLNVGDEGLSRSEIRKKAWERRKH